MVFYKKEGFPKEKDIVLCKVKKILPHSVFVELIEYDELEGMIHISEISSRWTKNINDVVQMGNLIVCRVERINKKKGHIDLSKKRVTSGEEKKKKKEIKNENRVEKLINYAYKKNKSSLEKFYKSIGFDLIKEYGNLYNFYEVFKEHPEVLKDLKIPEKIKKDLIKSFESLTQKSRVTVKKEFKFYAKSGKGVNDLKGFVKEVKKEAIKEDEDNKVEITYINSPKYLVSVNSKNYKIANNFMDTFFEIMNDSSKKYNVEVLE